MGSVSIYFPGGDFTEALKRFVEGREQFYHSHNEVARLVYDLVGENQTVNVYSFVTSERREVFPLKGLRIIELGAKEFSATTLLEAAAAEDRSDSIIVHFPNRALLKSALTRKARICVVLADSFNKRDIRSTLSKWRIASLLNDPRIELVANHCRPATEHLAKIGVKREKLIAYDIPHRFDPASYKPKQLAARTTFEIAYAGTISDDKGISELIRAVGLLREQGIEIHCTLAGLGDIDSMKALSTRLNVSDLLTFVGRVGNSEVFNLMQAADLVVVPSRSTYPEGFPFTFFEAIASRTPIVCSNHPMFREVMIDRRNASIFSSGDYLDFAEAIRRTLTDPILYRNLSANALLTWETLKGPADWRTLIFKWVVETSTSPWIRERMLMARPFPNAP